MSDSNPKNVDPITKEPGAHPVGTGVGATGGALAGAAAGSIAGPIGTVVGGIIGAVAGGLAGKEVAEKTNPTEGGAPSEHKLGTGVGSAAGARLQVQSPAPAWAPSVAPSAWLQGQPLVPSPAAWRARAQPRS